MRKALRPMIRNWQVSVAQHSEVVVSEAKYVRDLTTYKAPVGEEAPAASEPKDAEDPKKEERKTAEEGFPAEDQKDAFQKNEDQEKKDVADPEDKTAKVEDPETEVPKPAESKPVEVSTEPSCSPFIIPTALSFGLWSWHHGLMLNDENMLSLKRPQQQPCMQFHPCAHVSGSERHQQVLCIAGQQRPTNRLVI